MTVKQTSDTYTNTNSRTLTMVKFQNSISDFITFMTPPISLLTESPEIGFN